MKAVPLCQPPTSDFHYFINRIFLYEILIKNCIISISWVIFKRLFITRSQRLIYINISCLDDIWVTFACLSDFFIRIPILFHMHKFLIHEGILYHLRIQILRNTMMKFSWIPFHCMVKQYVPVFIFLSNVCHAIVKNDKCCRMANLLNMSE